MIARHPPIIANNLFTSPIVKYHLYVLPYQNNKHWIVETKYKLNLSRINQLVEIISNTLSEYVYDWFPLEDNWSIVSVPPHWRTRWHRRFDLNSIIANKISKPLGYGVTRPIRNVSRITQGECKTKQARIKNAKHKFKLKRRATVPRNIILFDDVVATGATMRACEKLLRQAGAKNVIWLSIAH